MMTHQQLINRAYALAERLNLSVIIQDLSYMSQAEIIGVVNFLTSLDN
jgi:hypothetical protein